MKNKSPITSDRVFGAVIIILGIVCLFECKRLLPLGQGPFTGDHALLGFAGGALIVFGALLAFVLNSRPIKPDFPAKPMLLKLGMIMAVFTGYSLCVSKLGYVLPTAAAGVMLFRLFGGYSWLRCAVISVLTTTGLYLVFVTGLGMSFPRGIFG